VKNICVIGTGYVGLVTGTCLAEWGNKVVCLDTDERKVSLLKHGQMPIYEPTLEERVHRNVQGGRLRFTCSYSDALADADFAFIAVPTPTNETNGGADLRYVESAARSIAQHVRDGLVVINKSTVPVGTGELVRRVIAEHQPRPARFGVVSNPEFLREGSAFADCLQPDRVVLGSSDPWALAAVEELYRHLGCPIVTTNLATAEMIKYASNAMLATRISFMNEVAGICERVGADAKMVAAGMGGDRRIGRAFLDAGLGYGGSCFPKDVKALMHMGIRAGYQPKLLQAVEDINKEARLRAVDKLEDVFGLLSGLTVALWGLAFKPHTDDLREAPGIDIARTLIASGARVRAYDPEARPGASRLLPVIEYCNQPLEAASEADAVILVTEWPEFAELDFAEMKRAMRCPVIIDGRNALNGDELVSLGFVYRGIGRHNVTGSLLDVELDRSLEAA
jgi:UDPglucose 6-dehydrogenase